MKKTERKRKVIIGKDLINIFKMSEGLALSRDQFEALIYGPTPMHLVVGLVDIVAYGESDIDLQFVRLQHVIFAGTTILAKDLLADGIDGGFIAPSMPGSSQAQETRLGADNLGNFRSVFEKAMSIGCLVTVGLEAGAITGVVARKLGVSPSTVDPGGLDVDPVANL